MKVKMERMSVMVLSLVLSFFVFASPVFADAHSFSDVTEDNVHSEAIHELSEMGGLNGYPDGTFKPGDNMMRQHVAVVMARLLNLETPEDVAGILAQYEDVSEDHYYADEIAAVTAAKVFKGDANGMFNPEGLISRDQTATILARAYSLPSHVADAADVNLDNVRDSHEANVQTFANLGLTTEFDDFRPADPVTRGQFSSFNFRTLQLDRMSVLHTNDLHGRVDQYPMMITTLKEARITRPNNVLLDAGDIFTGTLYFNEFKGQAALHFMNMMDYDAYAFGNHEFDLADASKEVVHEDLINFVKNADFPFVAANMDFSAHAEFDPYTVTSDTVNVTVEDGKIYDGIVKEINGEQVGIFGLSSEDIVNISSPVDITFQDFATVAAEMVQAFEAAGVDRIIALTHLGYDSDPSVGNDLRLAEEVDGIDIIVGGHSHDYLYEPTVITVDDEDNAKDPTIIVQAGEYGNALGTLDVLFNDAGVIEAWKGEILDVNEREADAEAEAALVPFTEAVEELSNELAGFSLTEQLANPRLGSGDEVSVRADETALGNMIADGFLRAGKKADPNTLIAFQNGGGVRAPLPADVEGDGPYDITVGDLITVQPFGNRLTLVDLTGAEIMTALETSVKDAPEENGGFLHVAGLTFKYDSTQPAGERVYEVNVMEDGTPTPLDADRTYSVAMNNFTAAGGDGYDVFGQAWEENRYTIVGTTDWEILRAHALALLEEEGEVNPTVEGRIVDEPQQ